MAARTKIRLVPAVVDANRSEGRLEFEIVASAGDIYRDTHHKLSRQ